MKTKKITPKAQGNELHNEQSHTSQHTEPSRWADPFAPDRGNPFEEEESPEPCATPWSEAAEPWGGVARAESQRTESAPAAYEAAASQLAEPAPAAYEAEEPQRAEGALAEPARLQREEVFARYVEPLLGRIYGMVCRRCSDRAWVDDDFQDILLHLWQHVGEIDASRHAEAWVMQCAVHKLLELLRARTTRAHQLPLDDHAPEQLLHSPAATPSLSEALHPAFEGTAQLCTTSAQRALQLSLALRCPASSSAADDAGKGADGCAASLNAADGCAAGEASDAPRLRAVGEGQLGSCSEPRSVRPRVKVRPSASAAERERALLRERLVEEWLLEWVGNWRIFRQRSLVRLLDAMPQRQRVALLLTACAGWSIPDVAKLQQRSPSSVARDLVFRTNE